MMGLKSNHGGDFLYHNIVFDLGGVVVNYNPREFLVDRFFHERTEKKLYDATFGSEEWRLLDQGRLSWYEASKIFKKRGREKDVAFEMQALLDEWTDMLSTRKATVSLIRILKKKGFGVYYLSNISHEVLSIMRQRDFWPLFDGGIPSCEVDMLKPDVAIYRKLLEEYKLVPQETIFTDDMRENTAAAFEAGITGIQFTDVKSFIKMLITYGIDVT